MRLPPLLLAAPLVAATLLAPRGAAAELALRRVLLSSAGIGWFEYEAEVDGPAELGLDVKLDEVDDVLKSLVVFDDAGGVAGIELPGRDARRSAFGNVPFGPEGLESPLAFLNSLRGVAVTVEGPRPMQGLLLRAETVRPPPNPSPAPPPADRTRVSLLTDAGLKQFLLEDSDSVQVTDPALRARIAQALAATRGETAGDARHLVIRTTGAGHRTLRVSFVAAAPLWKASYRLVLPPPGADPKTATARLQGWATLENLSGTDWPGVSVALQYGNPVTFHQALYRSYFVSRPEVPVEVGSRFLPDVDTRSRAPMPAAPEPPPPPPPAPALMAPAGGLAALPKAAGAPSLARPAIAMAPAAQPVAADEGAEETVFTIPVPVELRAGHSASLPILDRAVPGTRVSVARPGQPHPFAALQLTNTAAVSLPAGVLTLYDADGPAPYAGDARLGGLPAGETRLVAYAQDLRTTVAWRTEGTVTVAALAAAGGVLAVDRRDRQVTHATLTAPANEPRRVLLEADKSPGVSLAPGFATPAAETETAWRFTVDLRPGEVKEVTFALDRNERQAVALLDDDAALTEVLNLQGTSDAARAALRRIVALRAQEAARTAERDALTTQRETVESDEERLRANLAVVAAGDALRSRLVRQLDADETRHAQLDAAIDAANTAIDKAHAALLDAIGALRI